MAQLAESPTPPDALAFGPVVDVVYNGAAPQTLVVCEHASNHMPASLNRLGLSEEVAQSHIAWDPGALGVAECLAKTLNAALVTGRVSRLIYDCNRPPEAATAIPEKSEIHDIPGNQGLDVAARAQRAREVYTPFCNALSETIKRNRETLQLIVTVHSFTPIFHGKARSVELGLLHGKDDRFSKAMMAHLPNPCRYDTRLNEPYAAKDGVAHTLDVHGQQNGLLNVMIEIRNDLIQRPQDQAIMAKYLGSWIKRAFAQAGGVE